MYPKSCCKTVYEQGLVLGFLMGLVTSKKRVGEVSMEGGFVGLELEKFS